MEQRGDDRRVVAASAAAIYSGAAFVGIVESLVPGGEAFSVLPAAGALIISALTLLFGPRVPRSALAVLGPLGAAMIGVAIATTTGYSDSAVLYMWPAVWMAFFFGTWGTALIIGWIGAVHGAVLLSLPGRGRARWTAGSTSSWRCSSSPASCGCWPPATSGWSTSSSTRRASTRSRACSTAAGSRSACRPRSRAPRARARRWAPSSSTSITSRTSTTTHGHELGDRVLVWLGALLKEQARGVDVAARVGGEEFVVLLPRADQDAAATFAERVRRAVATVGPDDGRGRMGLADTLRLTVSAGVASAVDPIDGHALLAAADQALYAAKHSGRNRTVVGPRADRARALGAAV